MAGFEATPASLTFSDFVIGNTYSLSLTLTNVSYGFNSFKVLDLPLAVRDFFEVSFKPMGNMSAGLSTELTVLFSPKVNTDLNALLQIQSKTGILGVPLSARVQRCDVSLPSRVLDFGSVIIGESYTLKLTIANSGAIPTDFVLDPYILDRTLPDPIQTPPSSIPPLAECVPMTLNHMLDDANNGHLELNTSGVPSVPNLQFELVNSEIGEDDIGHGMTTGTSGTTANDGGNPLPTSGSNASHDDRAPSQASAASSIVALSPSLPHPGGMMMSHQRSTTHFHGNTRVRDPDTPVFGLDSFEGRVPSYGNASLAVTFSPFEVGEYTLRWLLTFDESDKKLVVTVKGVAEPIPISVATSVLDLGVCYASSVYRDVAVLHNDSSSACKVSFAVPPTYAPYVDFLPQVGFVQAHASLDVQVKFAPSPDLLRIVSKFASDDTEPLLSLSHLSTGGGTIVNVPVKISVKGQALPVYFHLSAALTSPTLTLSPSSLDFGRVSMSSAKSLTATLHNPSCLVQSFGCVGLSPGWSVSPCDGFGSILPGESLSLQVSFQPKAALPSKTKLVIKSSLNQELSVSVSGVGYKPPLSFSVRTIHLPATPLGSSSSARVYLCNHTRAAHRFQIATQPGLPFSVSPSVGSVPPKSRVLLSLTLSPTFASLSSATTKERDHDVPAVESGGSGVPDNAESAPDSGMSSELATALSLLETTLQNPHKHNSKPGPSTSAPPPLSPAETIEPGVYQTKVVCMVEGIPKTEAVLLDVVLPVVQPGLVVVSGKGSRVIDFGEVPMGERVSKAVTVRNVSRRTLELGAGPLDPLSSAFVLLSGLRPLGPGGSARILLEFTPGAQGVYEQDLRVYNKEQLTTRGTTSVPLLSITLKGVGSSPSLQLDPVVSELDLGDLAPGNVSTFAFTLTNSSVSFDVAFETSLKHTGELNHNGLNPFSVSVPRGKLLPGQTLELEVTFAPDHASAAYADVLHIDLPSEHDNITIPLRGTAHDTPVFLLPAETPSSSSPMAASSFLMDLSAPLLPRDVWSLSSPNPSAPPPPDTGSTRPPRSGPSKRGGGGGPPPSAAAGEGGLAPLIVYVDISKRAASGVFEGSARFGNVAKSGDAELVLEPLSADAIAAGFLLEHGTRYRVSPSSSTHVVVTHQADSASRIRSEEAVLYGSMRHGLFSRPILLVCRATQRSDSERSERKRSAASVSVAHDQ